MKKIVKVARMAVLGLLAGSMVFQVGGCTMQVIKAQLSNGLATSLTGMFNIIATDLANEIFDVDD